MIGGWPTKVEKRELDRVIEAAQKESERRWLRHLKQLKGEGEIMDRKDCLVVRELKGTMSKESRLWYLYEDERRPTTESRAIARAKEIAAKSPGIRVGVAKLIFEARMTGMKSGGFEAEFEK